MKNGGKRCKDCRKVKSPDQFYACDAFFLCKKCRCERTRRRRRDNPSAREHDLVRNRRNDRKEQRRKISDRYDIASPAASRACGIVAREVRIGRLKKQPCTVCGTTTRIEAHHEDYSKPLDVVWLCALHHRRLHAEKERGAIP